MLFLWEKRHPISSKTPVVEHSASYSYDFSYGWDATSSYMERVEECRKEVGQRWESWMATACLLPGQPQLGMRGGQMGVTVQSRQL